MSSILTRRRVALCLGALGAASTVSHHPRGDARALDAAARQEGSLTWYVAQLDTETAESFGRKFTASHPGITVEVIRTTGQVAFQRLMLGHQEPHAALRRIQRHRHLAHAGTEGAGRVDAVHAGQQFRHASAVQGAVGCRLYYVTNAGRWVLMSNREKVTQEAAPKAWTDLLDPEVEGPRIGGASGVQRRCGRLDAGDAEALRLGISSRRWRRTIRASAVRPRTR